MHLDHTYNLHFYEEHNSNIKIYCPIPENEYLTDFNTFLEDTGINESGLGELYRKVSFESLKYKDYHCFSAGYFSCLCNITRPKAFS